MTLAFNRQTLPLRKDFLIAGTCCHLSTNSHDLLRAVGRGLPIPKQNDALSFEMNIIVDSALDSTSEHPAHFRGLRHLVFAILPPRSFLTYDLLRRRVHGVLSTAAARDDSFCKSLLLPITLGVLGTHLGVVPLHCACLERNGRGFLVAGVSGAGKSTLAAALAQRGFAFISDDWTYVSREQSTLVAHGLSAPIKLLPDAVRFFPELGQFSPRRALNGELAYEIDPTHSIGFTVKDIANPLSIFFLERASTLGCHIVPCQSQYVRDFFEKNAERLPDDFTEAKTIRSSIIRSLSAFPSWILRTGESPRKTAEAVDQFLAEASHARP
jgi:HPr Serine kinase C-terminal domain